MQAAPIVSRRCRGSADRACLRNPACRPGYCSGAWRPSPTHLPDEETARREGVVANHLGIHPEARPSREKAVLGIPVECRLRHLRRLAIRGRSDEEAKEPLGVPARLTELARQPVEELGG